MPSGGQLQCILGSGCNSFLIFPLLFFTSRFIVNECLPGPRRPVRFCIPQFWFLLAGRLDVVDRLYLKRALVIACSVRCLCCRQMGPVNVESVLDLHTLLQLASGEPCQHFSYYLLAIFKRIAWIFTSFFFFNIKQNHIYGEVLSHLFYSPLIIYIFFGIEKILKMLVQAGMNGCQQFFQTCEKIYFLPENYTYGLEW